MRNFSSSLKHPNKGSGTFGRLMKGLLLSLAVVLFQFTQVQAQVNDGAVQAKNQSQLSNHVGEVTPHPSMYDLSNLRDASGNLRDMPIPAPNPDLSSNTGCSDLIVYVVLDESGSMNGAAEEEARAGALALAQSFENSFAQLRIIEFAAQASFVELDEPLVNEDYIANLEAYLYGEYNGQNYASMPGGNPPCAPGYTNWEDAFQLIAAQPLRPNLVLFLTDGNPTAYNGGVDFDECGYTVAISPNGNEAEIIAESLAAAINASNALKTDPESPTKIFAIGVGNGINEANLILISGGENFADNGDIYQDDYSVGGIDEIEQNLTAGINSICGTVLSLSKSVSDEQVCSEAQVLTFTIEVENTGRANIADPLLQPEAANVVITDIFPSAYANLTIVGAPIAGAEIIGQELTYNVGALAFGESATIEVEATLTEVGSFENTAFATANNADEVSAAASAQLTDVITSTVEVTACESYTWEVTGLEYDFTQVVEVSGTNADGCATLQTLDLTINNPAEPTLVPENSCGPFTWDLNGETYAIPGQYTEVVPGVDGACDETFILDLSISEGSVVQEVVVVCEPQPFPLVGCYSDDFGVYCQSGVFEREAGVNAEGCTIINILYLTLNIEGTLGGECNDGDPLTENDVIVSDGNGGCACAGDPILFDCPDAQQNVGDTCDDGDDTTENDQRQADCSCAGTPIPPVFDCPDAQQNVGDLCDDGDDTTENDQRQADCSCAGTPIPPVFDCPDAQQNVGDLCDDGDDTTENDQRQADCSCAGTPIPPVFDCPDAQQNVGDLCDDGDDTTENDQRQADCSCAGTPIPPVFDCPDAQQNVGESCDDNDPTTENDTRQADCSCAGTPIPPVFDCPDAQQNFGDSCNDGDPLTENDARQLDCSCAGTIPNPNEVNCDDWVVYLADIVSGGTTNIYSVNFTDASNASLELIATSDIQVHIAYNSDDNLIYVVSNADGSYRTLDPHADSPEFSEVSMIAPEEGEELDIDAVTMAAFNNDGKLVIGNSGSDLFYSVNVSTNIASLYDSYSPIEGGDVAFGEDGTPYMATREGDGGLYVILEGDNDQLIGDLPENVTGMALASTNQLLVSQAGATSLLVRELNGNDNGQSINLFLGENPFQTSAGDMASGCNFSNNNEGDCADFSTFYANHGPGVIGTDLYRVDFSGATATLTFLTNVNFEAHIAYNAEADLVYLVNANGSFIRAYDPTLGVFEPGDLAIAPGINSLYAIVYNPADEFLYVGDADDDEIYTVDLGDGSVTYYANGPVNGGDLALQDGKLILATRSGNRILEVVEGGDAVELGNIPSSVNGMARANNSSSLISSHTGQSQFFQFSAADGSPMDPYNAIFEGEAFTFVNGDMAADCGDSDDVEACVNFRYYLADSPQGASSSDIYGVELAGGNAVLTFLVTVDYQAHLAFDEAGQLLYIVNRNNGAFQTLDISINSLSAPMELSQDLPNVASAVIFTDGSLYIGDETSDDVFSVNVLDGVSSQLAGESLDGINGGDLVVGADGVLYYASRNNGGQLLNVMTNAVVGNMPNNVTGVALMPSGNLLTSSRDFDDLRAYGPTGSASELAIYPTVDINGDPIVVKSTDLASGCTDPSNLDLCEGDNGECYGTVLDYVRGLNSNGGAISDARADTSNASGAPEGTNQLVFTTLGYGGSITFRFKGLVPNGPGNDIEVVETSFNTPGCDEYAEYADVYVSQDNITYYLVRTICKTDPFVDISFAQDADGEVVSLDCVKYVRLVNNGDRTSTPDGYDVDGIIAIHNCEESDDQAIVVEAPLHMSQDVVELTSYPNPTAGVSQAVFTTTQTVRTTLEVYDMNGRNVSTLFNQVANANQEYRVDFDGAGLPNGVYVYRLTTENETIIEKFMIAK